MNNKLIEIASTSGLDKEKSQTILDSFTGFFKQAEEWKEKAKGITVTDVSQTDKMESARQARLALQRIRCDAENTRKKLKKQSLREGKAIDGIANVIKAAIIPIEEMLLKQEKFAETIEKERKDRITAERIAKLTPYVENIEVYNVGSMTKEGFDQLLKASKAVVEARELAEKKADEERVAKRKKELADHERAMAENARLKVEADEREKKEKEVEAERAKERAVIEARERKEREAKEKAQDELREAKEIAANIKAQEQEAKAKKVREDEEAKRQDELKPEKEKLFAYAQSIKSIEAPQGISKAGLELIKLAEGKLLTISQEIKEGIKNL